MTVWALHGGRIASEAKPHNTQDTASKGTERWHQSGCSVSVVRQRTLGSPAGRRRQQQQQQQLSAEEASVAASSTLSSWITARCESLPVRPPPPTPCVVALGQASFFFLFWSLILQVKDKKCTCEILWYGCQAILSATVNPHSFRFFFPLCAVLSCALISFTAGEWFARLVPGWSSGSRCHRDTSCLH